MIFVKAIGEIGFYKELDLAKLGAGGLTHAGWEVVAVFIETVFFHGMG
jgi:hypothetical protein